jgi:hypothetical protein
LLENHGGKQHGEKGLKKGDMEMEKKACIAKKKKKTLTALFSTSQ